MCDLLADAGISSACAAATEPEPTQKAKKSKLEIRAEQEIVRMKQFILILGKSCLSSQLAARTHRAILIDCLQLLTESLWIVAHKQGTAEFTTAAKSLREAGKSSEEVK